MSAYIVDRKCIDNVIHGVRLLQRQGQGFSKTLLKDRTEAELGFALWQMNEEAVYQRYPDDRATKGMGTADPYKAPYGAPCTPIQAYKSAQSLRYQCSEGRVPEWELYTQLEALIHDLADYIISRLPDYETAAW